VTDVRAPGRHGTSGTRVAARAALYLRVARLGDDRYGPVAQERAIERAFQTHLMRRIRTDPAPARMVGRPASDEVPS